MEEAASAFDTFNLDLMYALPGQTLAGLEADLEAALALRAAAPVDLPPDAGAEHLLRQRTRRRCPTKTWPAQMLDRVSARCAGAGLQRYEVSAFARDGHRCRHNLNYWQFGDYLGIGAGAHGKLSFPHRVLRQQRWREPARYMEQALAGLALSQDEEVARAELPFEFMLNALRLREGVPRALFSERTGMPTSAIDAAVLQAQQRGLLQAELQTLQPTERGFDFLNDLQAMFLPARASRP